eukprot:jgi/Bigna1/78541/fgenesh1_pg.55_\
MGAVRRDDERSNGTQQTAPIQWGRQTLGLAKMNSSRKRGRFAPPAEASGGGGTVDSRVETGTLLSGGYDGLEHRNSRPRRIPTSLPMSPQLGAAEGTHTAKSASPSGQEESIQSLGSSTSRQIIAGRGPRPPPAALDLEGGGKEEEKDVEATGTDPGDLDHEEKLGYAQEGTWEEGGGGEEGGGEIMTRDRSGTVEGQHA